MLRKKAIILRFFIELRLLLHKVEIWPKMAVKINKTWKSSPKSLKMVIFMQKKLQNLKI